MLAQGSVKKALVTGGSRGIGAAVCRALARDGWMVYVNYNKSKEKALALAEETEVPITVRITSCNYYWQFETMIKAQPDPNIDAIDEVSDSPFTIPNAVYDLQGRRVYTRDLHGADLLKGLYIVNGKLILKR